MPDAQCVRSLVCSVLVVAHECSRHGHTENIRHSPRNGFTAYFVLSPVSEFWFVTVVGGLKLPQTWHQQRVSGPHDLAVRLGVFVRHAHARLTPKRPSQPLPYVS